VKIAIRFVSKGEIASVVGTEYDLSSGQLLESAVPAARGGEGFCVNYCISQPAAGQLRYTCCSLL
jgi:hypothetical protein